MTDKPMTLRERVESYVESLGGEMDGFELTQDGLRAILDAILTETCVEDAERDRLARIGKLVEGLADRGLTVSISDGEAYAGRPYTGEHLPDPIGVYDHTLLDALEALRAKVTGGTDER